MEVPGHSHEGVAWCFEVPNVLLLEIKNINTFYGPSHVLFDVSLSVERGDAVGLLGRNGAGKSTTMKSIIGLVPPANGQILYRGQNLIGMPPHQACRLGIAYVPEDRRIFWGLTVLENLEIARRSPSWKAQMIWEPDKIFGLFPVLGQMASRRGGKRAAVAVAHALLVVIYSTIR